METCKNCGRPLIPNNGKCIYCGADINEAPETEKAPKHHPQIVMRKKRTYSPVIDIVICIDCSSSMIPIIDSVKNNLLCFFKELEEERVLDWRVRVVGYQDLIIYESPFVNTVEDLKMQLKGIEAKGEEENGDSPVVETIWYATKGVQWRKAPRIVLLFTDAPAKPIHDYDLKYFMDNMYRQHIRYYIWGKGDSYEKLHKVVFDDRFITLLGTVYQFEDPIEFYSHRFYIGDFLEHTYPEIYDPEYP